MNINRINIYYLYPVSTIPADYGGVNEHKKRSKTDFAILAGPAPNCLQQIVSIDILKIQKSQYYSI